MDYLMNCTETLGFPGGSVVKNLPANAGDVGLILGLGRTSGEGNGNLLQYSCLGKPMDWEAWWATVSVQLLSSVQLFVTPWTVAHQASLSITNFHSLLKLIPLSWWCHPIISSSIIPYFSCLQSFPASGSFQMSQFFPSGGQSIKFQFQHQSFQWIFRTDFL